MPTVNLTHLARSHPDFTSALNDLNALADTCEGPLRITVKNGEPHIGVRSWATFFFEGLCCGDKEIAAIRKETIKHIQNHIDPLLKDAEQNAALQRTGDASAKAGTATAANLSFKLRARATGKSLRPELGEDTWIYARSAKAAYQAVAAKRATARTFSGMIAVPQGLSVSPIPIAKVMADLRLIASSFIPANSTGMPDVPTRQQQSIENNHAGLDEDFYFAYYLHNLSCLPSFASGSVAVELNSVRDYALGPGHFEGAWRAATHFIREQKKLGRSVSVLLCTGCPLPKVISRPHSIGQDGSRTDADYYSESEFDV